MRTTNPQTTEMREAIAEFFAKFEDVDRIELHRGKVNLVFIDETDTTTPQVAKDLHKLLDTMVTAWHWPWSPKDKLIIVITRTVED